jgi:hypothetical protein
MGKQLSKYFLGALVLVGGLHASVSVLQYNAKTHAVTPYEIPLDTVSYIVGNGQFAFAVDDPLPESGRPQNPVIVSVFNGASWSNPVTSTDYAEGGPLTTYVNGSFVMASYDSPNAATMGLTTNYLLQDSSGDFEWHSDINSNLSQMSAGRMWQWKDAAGSSAEQLTINTTLNAFDFAPTTNAAAIATMNQIQKFGDASILPFFDSAANSDKAYVYSSNATPQRPGGANVTIEFSQCSVAHNSTSPAADVSCGGVQSVDVPSLLPTFTGSDMDVTGFVLSNGVLVFDIVDSSGLKSQYANIWSSDGGKTWVVSSGYADTDLYDPGMPRLVDLPFWHDTMSCPFQKAQPTGTPAYPQQSYILPATFACLDYAKTASPVKYQDYVLKADDLGEAMQMNYATAAQGLWLTGGDDKTRLYYIPFDTSKTQVELPPAPTALQQGSLKFAVFSDASSSDVVVACAYHTVTKNNMISVAAGLALAQVDDKGKWSWAALPDSNLPLASNQVCALSNDQLSSDINFPTGYNYVYPKDATIWVYPVASSKYIH